MSTTYLERYEPETVREMCILADLLTDEDRDVAARIDPNATWVTREDQ